MNTEKVYILEDRGILYINGPDSEKFLQNLISNDIQKVNESKSCFASLLSPQGKFLFDFIVVRHKDGYLLDCEKRIVDQLYKKLVMYKLKSKVKFTNSKDMADYDWVRDIINLRRSYPSVKEFVITVLHEIRHALDRKKLGRSRYEREYSMAGELAVQKGGDFHDDNKFEEFAESWAIKEYNKIWKNKF